MLPKNLSRVCDVVEISSKALKETNMIEFLSQETSLKSRRLKQKSPFYLKVTSVCLGEMFEMLKRSHF